MSGISASLWYPQITGGIFQKETYKWFHRIYYLITEEIKVKIALDKYTRTLIKDGGFYDFCLDALAGFDISVHLAESGLKTFCERFCGIPSRSVNPHHKGQRNDIIRKLAYILYCLGFNNVDLPNSEVYTDEEINTIKTIREECKKLFAEPNEAIAKIAVRPAGPSISELEEEITRLKKELKQKDKEILYFKGKFSDLVKQKADLQKDHERALSSQQDELESKIRNLQQQINNLNDDRKKKNRNEVPTQNLPNSLQIPFTVQKPRKPGTRSPIMEIELTVESTVEADGKEKGTLSLQVITCKNKKNSLLKKAT